MAIVRFCSSGFRPNPLAITKSAFVGSKGFVIKFVNIKKNS